jgi:hypothetical protein
MNFRNKLVAVVGSALILASSLTMGAAQSAPTATGNATVRVTSDTTTNYLAVSINSADFGGVPYSFQNQQANASLTVGVTDTRGSAAGWNVSLNATDFRNGDGSQFFGIGNLSLVAGTQVGQPYISGDPMPSTANMTAFSAAPVQKTGDSTTKIWSAAELAGAGKFELPMAGTLTVPGGTLVGDYTSVVTVSIISGP